MPLGGRCEELLHRFLRQRTVEVEPLRELAAHRRSAATCAASSTPSATVAMRRLCPSWTIVPTSARSSPSP